jgi:hypothetical protein
MRTHTHPPALPAPTGGHLIRQAFYYDSRVNLMTLGRAG